MKHIQDQIDQTLSFFLGKTFPPNFRAYRRLPLSQYCEKKREGACGSRRPKSDYSVTGNI